MTVDLRTRYLGLELRSPIVASAAPQNGEAAMAARLEAAGVGAMNMRNGPFDARELFVVAPALVCIRLG
jgi:hypothetical protein